MQTPAMPCAPLDATEPKVEVMQLENVLYFLAFAGLFFLMMRFGCGAHITGMHISTAKRAATIMVTTEICAGYRQIRPPTPFAA